MIKHALVLFLLAVSAALPAAETETVCDADFLGGRAFAPDFAQCDQPYYQPLGKIEPTARGLAFHSTGETPALLETVRRFAVSPGDRIYVTLEVDCAAKTRLMLQLFEYAGKNWVKNETHTIFAPAEGKQTIRRVITVTEKTGRAFSSGALAFGTGKDASAVVSSIRAMLKPAPEAKAEFRPHPTRGLIAHYDASNAASLTKKNGKILSWKNLASKEYTLLPRRPEDAPQYVPGAWNKHGVVRFSGAQELLTREVLNAAELTVFAVFRRLPEQAGSTWQHLLYYDANGRHGAANYTLSTGSDGGAAAPKLYAAASRGAYQYPLLVGSNGGAGGFLSGDLAEVLIYDTAGLTPEKIDAVRTDLKKKWGIVEDDYLRVGGLPKTPERVSDALPLSDQRDKDGWKLIPEFSDEFNGQLDRSKWLDMRHYTLGIPPARLLPENVEMRDGKANIMAKYDASMPSGRIRPRESEYHSFSVGRLYSRYTFRYGYIETRAKVLPSSFNSAFWLYGVAKSKKNGERIAPEIDIFEIAGKSYAHTYSDNTALHCVFSKPQRHVKFASAWISPFKFTDDYHVYGLEWRPDRIIFYIDGAVVRDFRVRENYWDMPMRVHFDLMPHFDWFGVPDPADFPEAFSIDYVRVWKNKATTLPDDDWQAKYVWDYNAPDKGFAYDYLKKYGKNIVMLEDPFEGIPSLSILDKDRIGKGVSVTNSADSGLALAFPAAVSMEASGEQYAAPSPSWPAARITPPLLKTPDAKDYGYLAVDYYNPGFLQNCTLIVTNRDGVSQSVSMLLKTGNGTFYCKLKKDLTASPIESVQLRSRGSDRLQGFSILDLRLEKE